MRVPTYLREELRGWLWAEADRIGWTWLSASAKSRCYGNWANESHIGGKLARYLDASHVRVYVKDSLMKGYSSDRLSDHRKPFRVLGIPEDEAVVEQYRKPHGCRLGNGRIVCWSRAAEWKTTVMAVYERAFGLRDARHGAVLFGATGVYAEHEVREMVRGAAIRLGVTDLAWVKV